MEVHIAIELLNKMCRNLKNSGYCVVSIQPSEKRIGMAELKCEYDETIKRDPRKVKLLGSPKHLHEIGESYTRLEDAQLTGVSK